MLKELFSTSGRVSSKDFFKFFFYIHFTVPLFTFPLMFMLKFLFDSIIHLQIKNNIISFQNYNDIMENYELFYSIINFSLPFVLINTLIFFLIVKRFHDLNKSGWYYISLCVPVIGFVYFIFLFVIKGSRKTNRFGEPPVERKKIEVKNISLIFSDERNGINYYFAVAVFLSLFWYMFNYRMFFSYYIRETFSFSQVMEGFTYLYSPVLFMLVTCILTTIIFMVSQYKYKRNWISGLVLSITVLLFYCLMIKSVYSSYSPIIFNDDSVIITLFTYFEILVFMTIFWTFPVFAIRILGLKFWSMLLTGIISGVVFTITLIFYHMMLFPFTFTKPPSTIGFLYDYSFGAPGFFLCLIFPFLLYLSSFFYFRKNGYDL